MYQIIKVSLTVKCIHHQNDHIYIIYTIMLWLQCHNLCNQFFSFNCLSQCTIYIKWMTGVRNTYTINFIPEHSTSKQEMVLEWSFFFMNLFNHFVFFRKFKLQMFTKQYALFSLVYVFIPFWFGLWHLSLGFVNGNIDLSF